MTSWVPPRGAASGGPTAAFGPAVDAAAADLAARAAIRSRQVSTHWLTPASPAAALGEPTA